MEAEHRPRQFNRDNGLFGGFEMAGAALTGTRNAPHQWFTISSKNSFITA